MRKIILIIASVLILLLPGVFSLGSVQTGNLFPNTANLCGDYSQYITITASNIYNKENTTLTSVSARLYLSGNTGLSFITSQDVNIGNINPLSTSPSNPSWTLQCYSPNQGIYTAYINYSSTNGYKGSSLDEAVTVITIHESVPFQGNISIIESSSQQSQQNYQIISDSTPTIKVTTTRNALCKGTLDTDEFYQDMDFIFYGMQKDHNYTFITPITEGQHSVYVKCKDEFDNIMSSSLIISFIVDTASPIITIINPGSKVVGEFTNLVVSVNEKSECRYKDDDDSFNDMENFDVINGTTFAAELTELEETSYEYYVKCKDDVGNIASKEVSFDVVLPPKARITIEKTPPLSKGTYELRLTSTKKLRAVPSLSYTFTDDTSFIRQVNLIKEGNYYKGYIIIDDSEKTRSGVFSFKGYDLDGNEGTEITEGAIFLVDTIKPNALESFEATATEDGIKLKWYYDGEKPDHFNIYRANSQGVGPIHFYASTIKEEYNDNNIVENQVYYYKIAAVDKAGNIGPLTGEASVYAKSGDATSEQPIINQNPPTSQTRQWKSTTEKNIDSLLIDLEWALNNLNDQAAKEKSVEELALVKQVMTAKEDILKLKTQIKGIDVLTVSDEDLRTTLSKADALIARTKKTTPQSIKIEKTTTNVQATTQSDIELAVSELLANENYSESQIKSYVSQMSVINNKIKVEADIKTLSIEYLDESIENRVLVAKKFSYENPESLKNVLAIEIIPKTVSGDISSIDIRTPEYTIVKADPVISWAYDTLSYDKQTITYVLLSNDNSESAKTTKTIILLDPEKNIKKEQNIITGFSIFLSKIAIGGMEIFGLIIGVLIILGLAMYYLAVVNEVDIGGYLKKIPLIKNAITQKEKTEKKEHVVEKQEPQIIETQIQTNIEEIKEQPIKEQTKEETFKNKSFSYLFKSDNPIKTIPEQYFFVKNGDVIRSITELPDVLQNMDDFTFFYHVNNSRNDFAEWVDTIYHNKELAEMIRGISSRQELIKAMNELMRQSQ